MGAWLLRNSRDRKVVLASGFGIVQRLTQIACTLVLMPVMLHTLGPQKFGIWGAAASLAWLNALVDFGTGMALVTLVAREVATGELQDAKRHISGALILSVLVAVPTLLVCAVWLAGIGPRSENAVYVIAVAGLACNLPVNSANNLWMSLQEGHYASGWELVQALTTTGALIVACMVTQNVLVLVAIVYIALVASNAGSMIHLYLKHPELRPSVLQPQWTAMEEVVSSGMLFFLMGIAGSLSFMLDNVLALHLLGPEASAQMTIALRLCFTATAMLGVLAQPLWPAFTEAAHKQDTVWILRNLVRGSSALVGVAILGSVILILSGGRLLQLWLHSALVFNRDVLLAISIWIIAQAVIRVPHLLLNAVHLLRFQTMLFAVTTSIALFLKFSLAARFGVPALLYATSVTVLLIALPGLLWRAWKWLESVESYHNNGAATQARAN